MFKIYVKEVLGFFKLSIPPLSLGYHQWSNIIGLTHRGGNKMTSAIFHRDKICMFIFFDQDFCILIQILLKYIPNGLTDHKQTLEQIMAWHWAGANL